MFCLASSAFCRRAHFGLPSVLVTNDFEKAFDLLERGTFCSAAERVFRVLRGIYSDNALVCSPVGRLGGLGFALE